MKKIYLLFALLLTLIIPMNVYAKSSLVLDDDKSVTAGKSAKFSMTINLDTLYNDKVSEINFDLEVTGGKTGTPTIVKSSTIDTWQISNIDNKSFKLTPKTSSSGGISTGDNLMDITIPVLADSPEGLIYVEVKNVSMFYKADNPSSSGEFINSPIPDVSGIKKSIDVKKLVESAVAELETLTISQGELNPAFSPNIYEYEVVVKDTINKFTISAKCKDNCSSINGNTKTTYEKSEILARGQNDPFEISVISQNGLNTKTYKISVYRGELIPERGDLKELKIENIELDPVFSPSTYNYYVKVPFDTTSLVVTYVPFDSNSTVTMEGNENLEVGVETPITIKVMSVDEKIEHTYTIYATREEEFSSTTVVESSISSSEEIKDNGNSKLLMIIAIIVVSLTIIGLSFYFIFKNNKNNKKIEEKLKKTTDIPTVAISHKDDAELLEYTKEYTDLPTLNNNKKTSNEDDYKKL